MEFVNRKRAVSLGLRVGTVFLVAVITVIMVAYFVLSRNFQSLLTDYSIKLVEAMTDQGVKMIEIELEAGRKEAAFLANAFQMSDVVEEAGRFPESYNGSGYGEDGYGEDGQEEDGYLRMVCVTDTETISSDGSERRIREREDIRAAFAGETSVYGPYFNEDHEFVVCYSAPIRQGDDIVGVLSVEKDGYLFCEIIKNIRFIDSGESYIINAEGTDIAVSDPNHIDWVNTQYNARKLFTEDADEETRTILELEQKGLNGETGLGTYDWNDGLCYVFYKPVPSTGWVLLAGLREEELKSMTQSAMFAAVSEGPVLGVCLLLVFVLIALISYWILASMKKSAEINEKLKVIANSDLLTGLRNRNSYHAAIEMLEMEKGCPWACIYIDVNGLHELNNHLGHRAGDEMLKAVAEELCGVFSHDEVYRIGGDEFVVLCLKKFGQDIGQTMEKIRQVLEARNYSISVGLAFGRHDCSAATVINEAEAAMQEDKRRFYEHNGNERHMRGLDKKLEQLITEKQDADTFLSVLAPGFKGVYFVNLSKDTVRHLFIPPYFEICLADADDRFSQALLLYAERVVRPEYYHSFEQLCDYKELEKWLAGNHTPEFVYQKLNGDWLKLQILKFREYTSEQQETLWIFAKADDTKGKEMQAEYKKI